MNLFIVGGTFDRQGGRSSRIVAEISKQLGALVTWNGGSLDQLNSFDPMAMDVLIWMPNVDNAEDKLLPTLKQRNPKLLLVSSKRVVEKQYTHGDIVGRLLQSHSALGIVITHTNDEEIIAHRGETYEFQLMDPLGNQWARTTLVHELCTALQQRIRFLLGLRRVRSFPLGPKFPITIEPEFIEQIQKFGARFSEFVNAVNPNRLLGNAATRCSYGFPSVRQDDRIFVTRRNVDKSTLGETDFVEVRYSPDGSVGYHGGVKPSVDTPIQLLLFLQYPDVRYMLHGHVYIRDAPLTQHKIPCGYIEEVDEIALLFPPSSYNFTVNLKGHGCLILARDLQYLEEMRGQLTGRPFPEV